MKIKWLVSTIATLFIVLVAVYYMVDPEIKQLDESEREKLGGTYVNLSNGFTHFKLTGPIDGRLVVLVHGGTIPIWTWDRQVEFLNNAGFRTLSYDKYGRGYSDRPSVTYSQELYTSQLFELINELGITQQFDLIGLSLGGGTAAKFTAQYPDRVRKLVLISPVINNFKVPGILQVPILGEFAGRVVGIKTIVNRSNSLFEKSSDSKKYSRLFLEQTTYKGFQLSILSMLRNDALGNYTDAYKKLGKQNRQILLIWGTEDTEITGDMIKDIRSHLPNLQFQPVEEAGHGIVFQKPQIINSLIFNFLSETKMGSSFSF